MQFGNNKIYAITPDYALNITNICQKLLDYKISILQYRRKFYNASNELTEVRQLKKICNKLNITFIINDDVDLCQKVGADGVHLGKNDTTLTSARKILGKDKIIGMSCYNDLSLAYEYENLGADYLAFGSMFMSTTKPHALLCRLDILTEAKKDITIPIVAIGGINFNNKDVVLNAGADMVAMISAFW